jgi:hypothetical protein
MVSGVIIVLIYLWSDESLVALAASLIVLLVGALLVDRLGDGDDPGGMLATARARLAPMFAGGDPDTDSDTGANTDPTPDPGTAEGEPGTGTGTRSDGAATAADRPPRPLSRGERGPAWRCRFDVTWDDDGLSGVPIGADGPQTWRWDDIDDISSEQAKAVDVDGEVAERLALRLDLPDEKDPTEPRATMVMLGLAQELAVTVDGARQVWTANRTIRSRLEAMTPAERTRLFAGHLGGANIVATLSPDDTITADALFHQIRRELLAEGWLYRTAVSGSFDDLVDAFEGLLEASGLEPIEQAEFDRLAEADRHPKPERLHQALDASAERRGFRIVYVDDGSDERLMGLVPDDTIDDWDGQPLGSDQATVVTARRLSRPPQP